MLTASQPVPALIQSTKAECDYLYGWLKKLTYADCKQVVFLSDALSVLQACQNHKLPNLTKALQQVATTRRAVLQWIPAHCGILGNEQADILAKEGARGEQHVNNVSFSEKKTHQSTHKAKITEG